MLQADKEELQAKITVKLLHIRERELHLYTENTRNLGNIGAITAGIAYFGLIYIKMDYFTKASAWFQATYGILLIVGLALSLRICFATTLMMMLGPGRALRGQDTASYHVAVEGMRIEFEYVAKHLHGAVHLAMATVAVYSWSAASPNWICSALISSLAVISSATMVVRFRVLDETFPVRHMQLTSGYFVGKENPSSEHQRDVAAQSPASSLHGAQGQEYQPADSLPARARQRPATSNRNAVDLL